MAEKQIAEARLTLARITDPYRDGNRTRRWVNTIFLGATGVIAGAIISFSSDTTPVNSNSVVKTLGNYSPFVIAIGFASMTYALLQLFLDGTLTPKHSDKSSETAATVPVEETVVQSGPGTAPLRSVRPKHVTTAMSMRGRLRREIENQGRKAQTNLSMGVITALSAIGFLCWLAWSVSLFPLTPSANVGEVTVRLDDRFVIMGFWGLFIAKLALSFTASIFSFFFLSTYRRNLGEIKYFQNELTNIEMKLFSMYFANNKSMDRVLEKLLLSSAETERNFILKKGETTVEVRSREVDNADTKTLANALAAAIKPLLHRQHEAPSRDNRVED